ncbi:sulfotransferase [Poseidonocella sp. HB161398]|uniref:sulfotransferase family protein n=1 Tax=Poseidonocella sp. HB161398 TaxID=2320855 RepID=UPI001F0CF8A3|nr:sulfotransferase [Poseidonocella sp. HB161398]
MISPKISRKLYRLAMPALKLSRSAPASEQPVFVIGSGRSGNTLVRRVLLASEQIYVPPETYVLGDVIEGWQRSAALPWRQRVWLFCAFFERHPHWNTFGLESLTAFAREAEGLRVKSLPALIDAFFRYLAREAGSDAPRWGDKTPWNTFHLPAIGRTFPQARYLWLVRDGRDVALSYVKAGLYPEIGAAADRWAQANRSCAQFARWIPHLRCIRYEDVAENPEATFRGVFDWLGLDFEPGMLTGKPARMGDVEMLSHHAAVASAINGRSVGKWRSEIDGAALARLPQDFHAWAGRLGYS